MVTRPTTPESATMVMKWNTNFALLVARRCDCCYPQLPKSLLFPLEFSITPNFMSQKFRFMSKGNMAGWVSSAQWNTFNRGESPFIGLLLSEQKLYKWDFFENDQPSWTGKGFVTQCERYNLLLTFGGVLLWFPDFLVGWNMARFYLPFSRAASMPLVFSAFNIKR